MPESNLTPDEIEYKKILDGVMEKMNNASEDKKIQMQAIVDLAQELAIKNDYDGAKRALQQALGLV